MSQSPQTVHSRRKRHNEREKSHIGWFVFCWKYTQSDFCSNAQGERTFYLWKEGEKVAEVKGGQGGHAKQWHSQKMRGPVRSSMCLWLRMLTDEAGETNWSQITMVLASSAILFEFTLFHFVFKCLDLLRQQVNRDMI